MRRASRTALVVAAGFTVIAGSPAAVSSSPAGAGTVRPAIIGGTPATTDDYPWIVALVDPTIPRPSGQFCGGTLVGPTKVVTVAHCVVRYQHAPQQLRLIGGRTDLRIGDGIARTAVEIWVHPRFEPLALTADIAVVTLNRSLPYRPLPVVEASDADLYRPGRAALTLGWGMTSATDPGGGVLQQAQLPLVSDDDCAAEYPAGDPAVPPFVAGAHTCAGYPADQVGIAGGDSGGPLVVAGKLVGVTSNRNLAEPTKPAIYTRVASYVDEVGERL